MISFHSEVPFEISDSDATVLWLSSIIYQENYNEGEVSIVFCDDEFLHKLNALELRPVCLQFGRIPFAPAIILGVLADGVAITVEFSDLVWPYRIGFHSLAVDSVGLRWKTAACMRRVS